MTPASAGSSSPRTLFYVDFNSYAGEGESITGSTYEHWDHGPFPPQLYDVERKLVREGRATLKNPEYEGDEARLIPTAEPTNRFAEWIKVLATNQARELAKEPSWQVEAASHRHRGWELTGDREPIPYTTHFIAHEQHRPPDNVLESARQVVREYERATGASS